MTFDFNDLEPPEKLTCIGCRYDLTGMQEHELCPECGHIIVFAEARLSQSKRKALIGMTLGLVSCVFCFSCYGAFLGLPFSVAAVILNEIAARDIQKNKAHPSSITFVNAGRICGLLGFAMNMLAIIYLILFWMNGPLISV